MKKLFQYKITVIVITLIVGVTIGLFIHPSSNQSTSKAVQSHIEASANQETYTCSMHPHIRKNEPGDCPICGMDLIPLETGEAIDPMAISMSPTAMQLAQVQTMAVGSDEVKKSIRLNGKVQADERLVYTQSSHIPGRIEKLSVNFTGEYVSQGQVIAYIYSPDITTAQQELLEAQKIKEMQPALFIAAKEKLKNWKLGDKQIAQILASGKTIDQFPILANVSGYVTEKMVNLGDYVKQGTPIYEIADLSKVWILFDVYESEISWIKKGASVSYTVSSLSGQNFSGTIDYIDPVINPQTRVAKARMEVMNKNQILKPEMFVSSTITTKNASNSSTIVIPKTAVMWTGKRSIVYIMNTTDQGVSFIMREVILGADLGERYIVESGLQLGEEIAINGTFSIDAAAQLAGKPSMMNREGGVAMTGHNHGGSTNSKMEKMSASSQKPTISNNAKKALEPLLNNYFNMKVALSKDDFEKAKEAGMVMNTSLGNVDINLFKGEAHTLWMQQSASLKTSLQHLEHLADIKIIREKFISISNSMIAIAESFDPMPTPIYVQHCPMADTNQGADWLSQKQKISNPYFGSAMLSCGETIKTIE